MDLEVVPKEVERVRQVLDVAAAHADLAAEGDRRPRFNRVLGQHREADTVDGVPCRGPKVAEEVGEEVCKKIKIKVRLSNAAAAAAAGKPVSLVRL